MASNDGYLLRNVVAAGVPALGIDPSPGPGGGRRGDRRADDRRLLRRRAGAGDARRARARRRDRRQQRDGARPDLNDFVGGFAALLADDGVLTVENPYVRDLVEHVEFDTIYHEHYCYFSCSSVDALMTRHGLHLNDVEYFPDLHGGTLRWHIGRQPDRTAALPAAARCRARSRHDGDRLLRPVRRAGAHVPGRAPRPARRACSATGGGSPPTAPPPRARRCSTAPGSAETRIDYVVDRNVHKQGKLMPGCRLPIKPVEALVEDRPDDVLLLAWNFADEIVAQQAAYVAAGGTFYVPVPHPRRIEAHV